MNIADPLSRLIKQINGTKDVSNRTEQYIHWILSYAEPKAIKLNEINESSASDDEILAVKRAIECDEWPANIISYKVFKNELCFSESILLRNTRIVMPQELRERTLQLAHEGHPGMSVMKRRLRAKVWWPKIDAHVEKFVENCRGCTLMSAANSPEPIRRTELPSAPWEDLAIDFCGPLPSGHYLFVIVDYYSRFIEVEVMTKIDSHATIKRC